MPRDRSGRGARIGERKANCIQVLRFALSVVALSAAAGLVSDLLGGSSLGLVGSAFFLALYGVLLATVTLPLVFVARFADERATSPRLGLAGVATVAIVVVAALLMRWAGVAFSWGAFVFLFAYGAVAYTSLRQTSRLRHRGGHCAPAP